jgi:AmiR/NasT family two-component response regulator
MIEKEFEGVADLRFANSDEHESLWKSRAAKANHTVMMVDFLSHKHVEAVKSTGVKAIVVRGGLTKLRDKLMELSV